MNPYSIIIYSITWKHIAFGLAFQPNPKTLEDSRISLGTLQIMKSCHFSIHVTDMGVQHHITMGGLSTLAFHQSLNSLTQSALSSRYVCIVPLSKEF